MDGLLIIDKPEGPTSHDVVDRVRRAFGTKRVGHTGTLDPFATGVMVILVGQATRLAQFLDKDEKEYEAVVQFGFETDTGDRTGKPISNLKSQISDLGEQGSDQKFKISDSRSESPDAESEIPDLESRLATIGWGEVLSKFRGEIMQTPPMYSAKKVGGKKLYELARKGEEVERQAVPVTIHRLDLIDDEEPRTPRSTLRIKIVCSAGTYIRTLAEDIGRAVGLGAHLTELRRTRAGSFDLLDATTLEQLQSVPEPSFTLIPMNEAVAHLPEFVLAEDRIEKTKNGMSTRTDRQFADGEAVRMIDANGNLVAIGRFATAEKTVQPNVVFS